jgi:hypothetical protein
VKGHLAVEKTDIGILKDLQETGDFRLGERAQRPRDDRVAAGGHGQRTTARRIETRRERQPRHGHGRCVQEVAAFDGPGHVRQRERLRT